MISFRRFSFGALALAAFLGAATQAAAQDKIPLRTVGPILATSTENVGEGVVVRGLSKGRVLVNAGTRQRVYSFDSTLLNVTVAMDSGTALGAIPIRASGLIPYTADSTLYVDLSSQSMLVLDPMGASVRVMSPPRAQFQDLMALSTPAAFGRPGFDPKGRLIYRSFAQNQPRMTQTADGGAEMKAAAITSDSSAIVRFDLDSRTADTVAWMNTPNPGQMSMSQKPDNGGMTIKLVLNPFQRADEWAMLTDGSVAVVRVHDYHIDWVRPDGTKLSTEKMPVLWRRYEDKDKQHYADSIKTLMDSVLKKQMATAASQPGAPKMDIRAEIVPEKEWPDYYAPIKSGAVLPDLDNRLWLLPTASEDAGHGYIYDVVACGGGIVERVQLPVGRVVAGFGPGGTIYLAHTDGKVTYLERTRLAVPKSATAGGGQ